MTTEPLSTERLDELAQEQGASDKSDRAVVNGAASVSALRASVPSAYGAPVIDLADLDSLDETEMVDGYLDGFKGEPEPQGNRSRAYWHGWCNGAVDGKHREPDAAQAILAKLYVAAQVIEARRAETGTGSVHESAVGNADAPTPSKEANDGNE